MKIALVSRYFSPFVGGIEAVVAELAELLARGGHEVTVHTTLLPETAAEEERDGYRIIRYQGHGARAFTPDVTGADVVHLHGADRLMASALALRGKPVVITMHAGLFGITTDRGAALYYAKRVFDRYLTSAIYNRFRRVVALDDREAQYCVSLGIQKDRIVQISNPVPATTYELAARLPDETRNGLLFLGRISPEKSIEMIINAAAKTGSHVSIAGSGEKSYEIRLQKLAGELGVSVEFLGWLKGSDKVVALKRAGALVIASPREGQSMAVLEAMTAKTPVIIGKETSAMPGLNETTACMFDRASADNLAAAIRQVESTGVPERVAAAHALVENAHSPHTFRAKHERVYLEALNE